MKRSSDFPRRERSKTIVSVESEICEGVRLLVFKGQADETMDAMMRVEGHWPHFRRNVARPCNEHRSLRSGR